MRRAALVMLQHHGDRLSYRDHEHKALKIRNTLRAGLSDRGAGPEFQNGLLYLIDESVADSYMQT
jgi:hypothetical protein